MPNSLIFIEGLKKEYRTDLLKPITTALKGITLRIPEGQVFGIVGRNGAGKSTLLKTVMGLIRPSGGKVLINGHEPSSAVSREDIGFLPEHPCLYPNLTVWDHLCFVGKVHQMSRNEVKERGAEILERVQLSDAAGMPVRKFSKGMVQRAALACALLPDPAILILDEPMSGLDPMGRKLVLDLISENRKRGKTILFCSHILNDVERICHRIGILEKGELVRIIESEELNSTGYPGETGSEAADGNYLTSLEREFMKVVQGKEAVSL